MPESFGARMRQRREEHGIALVTIAQRTKIKQSLLTALERDDVSHWPSGIYRRAFIRAYAQAIDLDPDIVVREFLEAHPEPPVVDVITALASALDRADRTARPSSAIRNVVDSAIGSLARRRRGTPVDDLMVTNGPLNGVAVPAELVAPRDQRQDPEPTAQQPEKTSQSENRNAPEPDFLAVARLCTEFARIGNMAGLQAVLQEAAGMLDATGIIVWVWDASAAHLKPALVHGYAERVVSQLPRVGRDAENATAAAFREAAPRVIRGTAYANGALVVPLLTPVGCVGVLAIELQRGNGPTKSVSAVATIIAALLAQMTVGIEADEPRPRTGTADPRWGTSRL